MERIVVTLGERSYPITIASGLFNEPASFLPLKSGEQVMLVTNETLAPLYLDKVRGVLEQAGVNVDSVILPDDPAEKNDIAAENRDLIDRAIKPTLRVLIVSPSIGSPFAFFSSSPSAIPFTMAPIWGSVL